MKTLSLIALSLLVHASVFAQEAVINRPEFGTCHALWRITYDPIVDDHRRASREPSEMTERSSRRPS